MDVELIEIREFLAELPAFAQLPEAALSRLPRDISVRYLRRGTRFPPEEPDQPYLYIVRTGAVELRDEHDQLIDKLAEGDLYTIPCESEPGKLDYRGLTLEDSLLSKMATVMASMGVGSSNGAVASAPSTKPTMSCRPAPRSAFRRRRA